jgi:hypothetical protein
MNLGFMTAAGPRDRASSHRACCRLGGASLVGGVEAIGRPGPGLSRKSGRLPSSLRNVGVAEAPEGTLGGDSLRLCDVSVPQFKSYAVERRHVEWITTGSVLRWVRKN